MQLAGSAAPEAAARARWRQADLEARPRRLERLRTALAERGLDAYFGLRPEHARYLTGFVLGDGEEKVAGASGRFFVSADESVVVADSRYRLQASEECPDSRIESPAGRFVAAWPDYVASLTPITARGGSVRRLGVEAAFIDQATWSQLASALPDVELVPLEGLVEDQRASKEPAELERIAAACAIADAALTETLADISVGATEQDLALALEWRIRTSGAEGLAFDVACLSGPRAALPHGSPGQRRIAAGEVLLIDFGARVEGYRSDMTRTLFVGQPQPRDLELYALVARAQAAAMALLRNRLAGGEPVTNLEVDAAARDVIEAAGHGRHFGHGTGHGIGLATHELPSLGRTATEAKLGPVMVFSLEPGVYLDGETGIRIEDIVSIDQEGAGLEVLTTFTRDVSVVGE